MALPAQPEWTETGAAVPAQPSLCHAQFQHKATSPRVPGLRSGGGKAVPPACARAAGLVWHRSFHMTQVAAAPSPVLILSLLSVGIKAQPGLEEHQEGQGRQGCQHRHGTQHGHTVSSPYSTHTGRRRRWGWWHGDHEELGGNGPAPPVSQELAAEEPSTASTRS